MNLDSRLMPILVTYLGQFIPMHNALPHNPRKNQMEFTQNMIGYIEFAVCIITLASIIVFSRWPRSKD
jgi:hypothetical protein